jgi:hypothetical protein
MIPLCYCVNVQNCGRTDWPTILALHWCEVSRLAAFLCTWETLPRHIWTIRLERATGVWCVTGSNFALVSRSHCRLT